MKHTTKLIITLSISVIALILEFILHQPLAAQILITIAGIAVSLSMLSEMIKSLKNGDYGVDLLAITAIISTLSVGQYFAAMIILIMLIGGDSLEDYASKKAHTELKSLLDHSPKIAHVLDHGKTIDSDVAQVQVGQKILVRPGEVVPLDGQVLVGQSFLDESSLTGESLAVFKGPKDLIYSGSINGDQALTMLVSATAKDSKYQQLVRLVQEADKSPSHFVRMADRYALPFTLAAFVIAGLAWFFSKDPVRFAEVLVVASPCPLILAAPVAMVSGMSRASRNGIIIKTGDVLEKLAVAKTAAFDKTGTITKGALTVHDVKTKPGVSAEKLLQLAASAEQSSNHILAKSLVAYTKAQKIPLLAPDKLKEDTGHGVTAWIDQAKITVGKKSYVAPENLDESPNQTAIYVANNQKLLGYITFLDQIRPEASQTIAALKAHGIQKSLMLTGDKLKIARKIAQEAELDEVKAELLPQDKIQALNDIPPELRPVIMVGDGVNDAPALACADVGIAMGANGASAASESADVVILKDDLSKVAKAVIISQDTMKITKQAVLLGIFICLVLMLIATTGVLPALVGALCQELVDTVSILWGLKARFPKEKS
ncbi:heavy metal-(Cd/Co/Hg/Pb/Zn)-translocating P-type ATPase [Ligilactobacillus sp. WC1T17]|uniref:Cd(2+)-exporting ATPase n=1 Tax=Ligilactobacillus ruminis TaxID=1623 RepID=A0ABY1A8T6_9LACO|nr:heavy metal-(Cd/Co/Hg/Pb/Zn)-translocating P-type ATPase [Ligilactobacillus ruminis]